MRNEYLQRFHVLLTASAILLLQTHPSLLEDSMIPPHFSENIYEIYEMLLFTRLHNTSTMIRDDDSVFSMYSDIQTLMQNKETSCSPDYFDMSAGALLGVHQKSTQPRTVSWSSESDISISQRDRNPLTLSMKLKRNISKKLLKARITFRKLGRL